MINKTKWANMNVLLVALCILAVVTVAVLALVLNLTGLQLGARAPYDPGRRSDLGSYAYPAPTNYSYPTPGGPGIYGYPTPVNL